MTDATLFVAIAIGCVIALLLLVAVFVYCIKRHHNKQQQRVVLERQAREERYRRHLMRAQVVRPPPYDAQRQNVLDLRSDPVPYSPPPVYKERATPYPTTPRQGQVVGLGSAPITPAPSYRSEHRRAEISTISRNVAPANTDYDNHNYYLPSHQHNANINNSNNNNSRNNNNNNNSNNSIMVREAPNNRATSDNNISSNNRMNARTVRNNAINRNALARGEQTHVPQYNANSSRIPPPPDPPSYSSANRREDSSLGSINSSNVEREDGGTSVNSTSSSSSNSISTFRTEALPTTRSARETPSHVSSQSRASSRIPAPHSTNGTSGRRPFNRSSNDYRQRNAANSQISSNGGDRRSDTSSATSAALQDLSLI